MSWSERIAAVVAREGVSVREFSLRMGWTPATVNNYVKGRVPAADFLAKVCEVYDINPRWLLLGEGEMVGSLSAVAVDRETLAKAIRSVDEVAPLSLPSDKRAKVILVSYERLLRGSEVTTDEMRHLIDLAT